MHFLNFFRSRHFFVSLAAILSVVLFVNCDHSFLAREVQKRRVIASQPVFNLSTPNADAEIENLYPCVDCQTPTPRPPPPEPTPPTHSATEIEVKRLCTSEITGLIGSLSTTSVEVLLFRRDRSLVCRFDGTQIKNSIMSFKRIPLSVISQSCPTVPNGEYLLAISPTDRWNLDPLMPVDKISSSQPVQWNIHYIKRNYLRQSGSYVDIMAEPYFYAKHDFYIKKSGAGWGVSGDSKQPWVLSYDSNEPNVECNGITSPLVIRMDSHVNKPEPLVLTSQADGIMYDILGEIPSPVPHSLKRISWHRSLQYFFLALPDSRGEVRGINELFGNATRGPDGKMARNGYAALAKFDGKSADGKTSIAKPDNLIDQRDAVFARLRVWQDVNFDGVAQPRELLRLSEIGIRYIDLNFDAGYAEVDRFGNETRYKSIVGTRDGKMHLIFDLWFKYLD